MNLPGFTAEASLYKTSAQYSMAVNYGRSGAAVQPAAVRLMPGLGGAILDPGTGPIVINPDPGPIGGSDPTGGGGDMARVDFFCLRNCIRICKNNGFGGKICFPACLDACQP
jgi:hypothetical protein